MSFEKEGAKKLVKGLKEAKIELISMKLIIDKKDDHIYPIPPPFTTPDHYEWLFLSDASIIQEGPGIRKYQYAESGIQFLTVTNITEGSIDFKKSQKYIDFAEYEKKYKHFTLNNGDIVTACSGASWGKSAVFESDSLMMLNTSTLRLRFFKDLGENKYLYYLTKSNYFKANLASHSTGQQANYGYSHYSKIPIPIPSTEEQKEIVEILDQAFESIDKAKANIEKNIENAEELFQSKANQIFSQAGEGWEETNIGEIGKVSMCKRILKHQTSQTGEIPFYKIGTFGKEPNAYIDAETFNLFKEKYSYPKIGDILLSASGTIGRRVIFDGKPAYFQDSNIVWIDNNEEIILNKYLYHFYEFCDWNPSKGATIKRLYNDDLRRIKISYPICLEKQKEIIEVIEILDNHIQSVSLAYNEELKNLEELKKSILQKAFSGELTNKNKAA